MSGMLNRNILRALYRANFEKIITYILDICALIVKRVIFVPKKPELCRKWYKPKEHKPDFLR